MNDLQKALKAVVDQYEGIEALAKVEGRELTETEIKSQKDLLTKANGLKEQLDNAKKMADLKSWAEQPDGQNAVKGSFDRVALPEEGALKGVEVDKITGEMAAKSFYGENVLKALKSGQYIDGLNDYLRNTGLNRPVKAASMKVLNEGGFTSGEAWLPPDFRNQLVQRMVGPSSVRQFATVYNTGTDMITFPQVIYNGDSAHGDSYAQIYTSGSHGAWRESSAASANYTEATNPVAGNIRIPVHTYTLPIIVTREQLEDNAFDLLGWVGKNITENAMLDQEYAFTNGDGAGQPVGFTVHPTMSTAWGSTTTVAGKTYTGGMTKTGIAAALSWPVPSDSLAYDTYGLLGMEGSLSPQYEASARWFASKRTYSNIRGLADTNGRPLWQTSDGVFANYVKGYPPTLLGYPIEKNMFLPNVAASVYPMFLGDLSGYYIVDRVGITLEVYRETLALRDQVLIYLRMRTGGALVDYYKMRSLYVAA